MIHEVPGIGDNVANMIQSAHKRRKSILADRPAREERDDLESPVIVFVFGKLDRQGARVDRPAQERDDFLEGALGRMRCKVRRAALA